MAEIVKIGKGEQHFHCIHAEILKYEWRQQIAYSKAVEKNQTATWQGSLECRRCIAFCEKMCNSYN